MTDFARSSRPAFDPDQVKPFHLRADAAVESAVEDLAQQVIGAAIEVHRELGPGYLESIYKKAMMIELDQRGIRCEDEHPVHVAYKGQAIGDGFIDILVENQLIVELKTVDRLAPIHTAQVISYLKATGLSLGLLLKLNVPRLKEGIKRVLPPK